MPLKTISETLCNVRYKLTLALLLATLFISVCAVSGVPDVQAQTGKSAPAQPTQKQKSKQIFLGGKNDSARGSSVTIRSDTPLNDYSAYRSGDRFYVVIPKANANALPKGASGRGFSDMQVQQRGNDVVLSYRLQPGSKPRVNQRFDRLDVVFDTAEGADATNNAANPNQPNQTPATANNARNNPPAQATQNPRTGTTPEAANPSDANRTGAEVQRDQSATGTQGNNFPPVAVQPQTPLIVAPPSANETPSATPSMTPASGEQQIAQTQPPATNAPITATNPAPAQPGSASFAAAVLRNWPALIGGLLLLGIVLFIMAQRSASKRSVPPDADAKTLATPAVKEATAPKLQPTAAKTATVSNASAAASSASSKRVETTPPAVVTTTAASALAAGLSGAKEKEKKKEPREASVSGGKTGVEKELITAHEKTTKIEPLATNEAARLASAEAVKKALLDQQGTSEVAPFTPADGDKVQEETKHLLAGESYDKAIFSAADPTMRQMVAAELLSALAGRNPARRQRAGAAFIEHGYFNETAHDLHFSIAPAERASAARSLGLLGDRIATSHLVAALDDPTMEVRRASVEALADIRDPKAVASLNALLEREKELKVKVPRKLVQRAIEACEQGGEQSPTPSVTAVPPPASVTDAAHAAAETAPTQGTAATTIATAGETAAATVEETPTLASEETPTVAVEETSIILAGETPTLEVKEAADTTARPIVNVEDKTAPTVVDVIDERAAVSSGLEDAKLETSQPPYVAETPVSKELAPAIVEESLTTTEVKPPADIAGETTELTLAEEVAPTDDASQRAPISEPEAPPPAPHVVEPPLFAGESLAVPTEEIADAAMEEITLSTDTHAAPAEAALEFEAHRDETPAAPVVNRLEGFETAHARHASSASDWVELDEMHTPPASPAAVEASIMPFEVDLTGESLTDQPEPSHRGADTTATLDLIPLQVEADAPLSISPIESAAAFPPVPDETGVSTVTGMETHVKQPSSVPQSIQQRLASEEPRERVTAIKELARFGNEDAFHQISAAFDDNSADVRSAAARSLYEIQEDRAEAFTRALREAPPERRRNIGGAIASSGLAAEAVGQLTGASRDKTYEAFSLLFLMAKAGEVQPLIRAIESHPDSEVRLAVVKLLALSGQKEILPAFRRLAVRGSLPTDVRSAVMEAIYQISSNNQTPQEANS